MWKVRLNITMVSQTFIKMPLSVAVGLVLYNFRDQLMAMQYVLLISELQLQVMQYQIMTHIPTS